MGLLEAYRDEIRSLCATHNVKTLYSFGSINTLKFTSESDIDLMVDFSTSDPFEYADSYFDLKFELENMFDRPIDLLESKAIKNPFLQQSINRSKVLLYGS